MYKRQGTGTNAACINTKILKINGGFCIKILHYREMVMSAYIIYAASIEQPFVVYAYLTGVINLKAQMIGHIVSSY